MVGSSPSGTLATSSPIAKVTASFSGEAGDGDADDEEDDRRPPPRSPRSAYRDAVDLHLQRADLRAAPAARARRSARAASPSRSRRRRLGLAGGAQRPGEDQVVGLERRGGRPCRRRRCAPPAATRRSAARRRLRRRRRSAARPADRRSPSERSRRSPGTSVRRIDLALLAVRGARAPAAAGTLAAPPSRARPAAPGRRRRPR